MKKYTILYAVFALVLGVTLLAFGIYLIRYDLAEMLVESMQELWILAIIFLIILYIPLLMVKIFFWSCILYGVFFIAAGIVALVSYSKGKLIHLQKNLTCFLIINTLILYIITIVDFAIILWFYQKFSSEVSIIFIVFITLTTLLSVAFEVITVITRKRLKQTLLSERQPL